MPFIRFGITTTHFWLANTIRFGNFPVMAPGAPNLLAEYHYGGAFLAASLAHIGQVDSAIIFFILTPLAATAAYLAASVLAAQCLKEYSSWLACRTLLLLRRRPALPHRPEHALSTFAGLPHLRPPLKKCYLIPWIELRQTNSPPIRTTSNIHTTLSHGEYS